MEAVMAEKEISVKIYVVRLSGEERLPVQDELVWSVHRDIAPDFVMGAREIMITHPV